MKKISIYKLLLALTILAGCDEVSFNGTDTVDSLSSQGQLVLDDGGKDLFCRHESNSQLEDGTSRSDSDDDDSEDDNSSSCDDNSADHNSKSCDEAGEDDNSKSCDEVGEDDNSRSCDEDNQSSTSPDGEQSNLEMGGEVPNGEIVSGEQIPGVTLDWYKIEVSLVEDGLVGDLKIDDEHIVIGPDTRIFIQPVVQGDTWVAIDPNGLDDGKVVIQATSWTVGSHKVVLFGFEPDRIGLKELVVAMDGSGTELIDATEAILNPATSICSDKTRIGIFEDKFEEVFWDREKGAKTLRLFMGEIDRK